MKDIKYTRLDELLDDNLEEFEPSESSITLKTVLIGIFLIGFFILFVFYFNTNLKLHADGKFSRRISMINGKLKKLKYKNATKFEDFYFRKSETQFLQCSEFLEDNQTSIDQYVSHGRLRRDKNTTFPLKMDCDSIKTRLFGDLPAFESLGKSIAFVRNAYTLYELQEVFLSMNWHPDHFFCYALDRKSDEKMKKSMRKLDECFENVIVLEKEYDFDRKGHRQDLAHFDCLERLLDRNWSHAITLQNFDMLIKTPRQLSDLSDLLNYTSIMGFDYGLKDRYDVTADWTPAGMKLLKNETGVPQEILHKKMVVRKSLNEVILSKMFVKSIFEKLNIDKVIQRFDDDKRFGVDEMMIMTLYENYLGLDGQMESNCVKEREDKLTRLNYWNLNQPDGVNPDCKSNWLRHSLCVFGVEYLKEISESPMVLGIFFVESEFDLLMFSANKVVEDFDFGTVLCVREMMKSGKTGKNPDTDWLASNFPQFREMEIKANGTFVRGSIEC
ncbi:hypothetical protein CRE_09696 [Caenorhabditis remanei]|uniref:Uncharacterized protein n=1 Tax=Caenorhabditis remanei TaxID=31234 RepID=E3MX27_CAERE|nr:hypothetical protein CRE_09696 [Caenorhabditis remanei]